MKHPARCQSDLLDQVTPDEAPGSRTNANVPAVDAEAAAAAQPADPSPTADLLPTAAATPGRPKQEPDAQPVDGGLDVDDAATAAVLTQLKVVAESCAAKFSPQTGKPTTWISIGLLTANTTFAFEIDHARIADFINDLGAATVTAGLIDVQFSLTKRASKAAKDLEAIYGIVVDVDRPTNDIVGEVERAGVPMPNLGFLSLHGFKFGYAAAKPITPSVFEELAKLLTLAFEGGDPTSWEPGQMQRLPTCLRATESGTVHVNFQARVMNAVPFEATPASVPFPHRVLRALGAGTPSPSDRKLVRDFLEECGIPAPDEPGSILYPSCPAGTTHDSKCCYVNFADDGSCTAHCLADHGGEGAKHWTEAHLADLAGATEARDGAAPCFDPLRHLPVTPGAEEYLRFQLRAWPAVLVTAVVDLWTRTCARREAEQLPADVADEEVVLQVYRHRLRGVYGLAPMAIYYERGVAGLVHEDPDKRALPVSSRTGPNLKTNAIELKSSGLWQAVVVETQKTRTLQPGWGPDAVSMLHKLALGHALVLAKLGVPAVTTYALPVAHVADNWSIHPETHHISAVTVRVTFENIEEIDAVEFFLALYRAGRLPFASENDVRHFVMLIASPLLRHIAPGLLGVYWFVGPPGAGKDFLAEMARVIWEAFATANSRVSFDISLAGELEQKRMLEMGHGCVFARAKEAGKRAGMADALIRLAGTDTLPGRGLFKDEISIPNTFTYVAESAEDLPDRREISRRTVQISVTFMDDAQSKGRVLDEVRAASMGLIKNLKRLIETRPPEWYLQQSDTGSRPVVPVALAQLLGATLPAVEGEDLTEVYESMLAFVQSAEGAEHGKQQLQTMQHRRADKASLEAKTLPSYSLAYFIDTMLQKPGKSELFSPFNKKSRELFNRILRETEYRAAVAKQGYMPVEIRGLRHALRIEDGRRFILTPELEFINKLAQVRAAAAAKSTAPPASTIPIVPTETASSSTVSTPPADPNESTFTADSTDLLKGKLS